MVQLSSPRLCCRLTVPLIPRTLTHHPSECSPSKSKQSEEKLDCFKWMIVLYQARKTPMLAVLEGKDSMSPAVSRARHPPAPPAHACSLRHQDRRSVPSCRPTFRAWGAVAGIRPRWWELPQAGAWAPFHAFCPRVGGLERQARGSHPAQPRGDETLWIRDCYCKMGCTGWRHPFSTI